LIRWFLALVFCLLFLVLLFLVGLLVRALALTPWRAGEGATKAAVGTTYCNETARGATGTLIAHAARERPSRRAQRSSQSWWNSGG
jgi:hypothetical protein